MKLNADVKGKANSHTGHKKITSNELQLYSLLAIPLLLVFVFSYLPMAGITIAFKDYKYNSGIFGSEWVGFDNFKFFFESDVFARITWNTLYMNFLFILIGTIAAILVAVLMFELVSRTATKTFQTILIMPNFISWVVASYMVFAFLNPQYGILNSLRSGLGLKTIDWYSEPKYWPVILVISNVWKTVGINSVMYYAALMGIDTAIFEAAKVDGANKVKVFLHIILPMLVPLITILTILSIGNIFRADFGLFYQIPRNIGLLYSTTDVIDTYIFRTMREVGDMGMSSAVGLLQSFVGFFMVILTNYFSKKINPDNALF
ncbi:MAG: ABC transporter permease subunit [Oscillospiraceae bacterium]